MSDLLVRPIHSVPFLQARGLGVEAHVGRYDRRPNWDSYVPFVRGVHLPYDGYNLAALDDAHRRASIDALKDAIDYSSQYPIDRMVMHSVGTETKDGVQVGDYDRLVDAIRQLAAFSADRRLIICIENNLVYFDHNERKWADSCEDWFNLMQAVDRPNVMLTLDSSHATNNVMHLADADARRAALFDYLKHSDYIGRVHWSDSIVSTFDGKKDQHLVPGKGDLPTEFHRAIKNLPVTKLLEQTCTEAAVDEGLAFIETL
ncbi:MAG: sugar phosphate isomerase/epimerase family protein [Planctomycetota bacterium]